jgi:hypothetical protein
VAWIGFAQRCLALITTEGELSVLSYDVKEPPGSWEEQYHCTVAVPSRMVSLRPIASITPDGELIAVRERLDNRVILWPRLQLSGAPSPADKLVADRIVPIG